MQTQQEVPAWLAQVEQFEIDAELPGGDCVDDVELVAKALAAIADAL